MRVGAARQQPRHHLPRRRARARLLLGGRARGGRAHGSGAARRAARDAGRPGGRPARGGGGGQHPDLRVRRLHCAARGKFGTMFGDLWMNFGRDLKEISVESNKNYNKLIKELKENQFILSEKRKLADYIINNNFSANIMKKKVKLIKKEILNERNSSRY